MPTVDPPSRRQSPTPSETPRPELSSNVAIHRDQDAPVRALPPPPATSGPIHEPLAQDLAARNHPGPLPMPPLPTSSIRVDVGVNSPYHSPGAHNPATRSNGSQPTSILQNPAQRTRYSTERPQAEDMDTALRNNGPEDKHSLPALPQDLHMRRSRIAVDNLLSPGPRSGIDYLVPFDEKASREKTAGERLQPTLTTAIAERDKYAFKAKMTGFALNAAIGLQVILSALTTGLSAASASNQQASIAPIILGSLSTLVASYLARARGSNEPELSIARVKDLEQFIRECQAFQMDHGHATGDKYDAELDRLRIRFEELLGNANGERRLAPPV